MAGNPCKICSSAELSAKCARLIAAGGSDRKVAAAIGASRAGVQRHRQLHLLPITAKLAEISARDNPAKAQRQEIMRAAEAGDLDPSRFLGLAGIIEDMRVTADRLARVAMSAEEAGQNLVVSSLSGQEIRLFEARGKLGAVGGYAPKSQDGASLQPFNLTIHLSGGRKEEITALPLSEVIENDPLGPMPSWFGGGKASSQGSSEGSSEAQEAETEGEFEEDV